MDRLREEQITERIAELLGRTLPDARVLDVNGPVDATSNWPRDWSAGELAAYRRAAVDVMKMLKPLMSGGSAPVYRDREQPFFVRAETSLPDLAAWLTPRVFNRVLERFDRAGNLMFVLRSEGGGSFVPAGLVIVVWSEKIAKVRTLISSAMRNPLMPAEAAQ